LASGQFDRFTRSRQRGGSKVTPFLLHLGGDRGQSGKVHTAQHGFGGVGRAVRKKLGTYELEEIVAYTLRIFGQGMKVACEIVIMAADAGLIPSGQAVIAIAGTARGADTAVVLRAANAQAFFDIQVMEVLCKPGFYTTE